MRVARFSPQLRRCPRGARRRRAPALGIVARDTGVKAQEGFSQSDEKESISGEAGRWGLLSRVPLCLWWHSHLGGGVCANPQLLSQIPHSQVLQRGGQRWLGRLLGQGRSPFPLPTPSTRLVGATLLKAEPDGQARVEASRRPKSQPRGPREAGVTRANLSWQETKLAGNTRRVFH